MAVALFTVIERLVLLLDLKNRDKDNLLAQWLIYT